MKALIVLLAVLGGLWLWRNGRRKAQRPPQPPATPPAPQAMVRCAVCGLHLPQADALTGQRGTYCSVTHQRQAEG